MKRSSASTWPLVRDLKEMAKSGEENSRPKARGGSTDRHESRDKKMAHLCNTWEPVIMCASTLVIIRCDKSDKVQLFFFYNWNPYATKGQVKESQIFTLMIGRGREERKVGA